MEVTILTWLLESQGEVTIREDVARCLNGMQYFSNGEKDFWRFFEVILLLPSAMIESTAENFSVHVINVLV